MPSQVKVISRLLRTVASTERSLIVCCWVSDSVTIASPVNLHCLPNMLAAHRTTKPVDELYALDTVACMVQFALHSSCCLASCSADASATTMSGDNFSVCSIRNLCMHLSHLCYRSFYCAMSQSDPKCTSKHRSTKKTCVYHHATPSLPHHTTPQNHHIHRCFKFTVLQSIAPFALLLLRVT